MAIKQVPDISPTDYTNQVSDINSQLKDTKNQMINSTGSTAVGLNIHSQALQKQLDDLNNNYKKQQWYGNENTDQFGNPIAENSGKVGALQKVGKFFNWFNAPLRGVVGATEGALGLNQGKNVLESAKENFLNNDTGDTFGDVLKKVHAPSIIAKPLGFVADMVLDPLNLLGGIGIAKNIIKSGGAGAELIPKLLGQGILKNTAELGTMATRLGTGALNIASKPLFGAGKLATGITDTENLANIGAKIGEGQTGFSKLLGTVKDYSTGLTEKATGAYNKTLDELYAKTGFDPIADAAQKSTYWNNIGQGIKNVVNKIPGSEYFTGGGDYFANKIKEQDDLRGLFTGKVDVLKKGIGEINTVPNGSSIYKEGMQNDINLADRMATGENIDYNKVMPNSTDEWDAAMSSEAQREASKNNLKLQQSIANQSIDPTGVKIFDDAAAKITELRAKSPAFDSFAKAFGTIEGLFKRGKLGTPSAVVNNAMGGIAMTGMLGVNIFTNPELYKTLGGALKMFYNTNDKMHAFEYLSAFTKNPKVIEFARNYPALFRENFGFSPAVLDKFEELQGSARQYMINKYTKAKNIDIEKLIDEAKANLYNDAQKAGFDLDKMSNKERNELYQTSKEDFANLDVGYNWNQNINPQGALMEGNYNPKFNKEGKFFDDNTLNNLREAGVDINPELVAKLEELYKSANPQSILTDSDSKVWLSKLEQKSMDPNNKLAPFLKMVHWSYTKPMEWFGKTDISFKTGLLKYLAVDGVTAEELANIAKNTHYHITAEDISKVPNINAEGKRVAGYKYVFDPKKAAEISTDTYINYNAMPAVVKVLRNIPLLGAPFACRSSDTEILTKEGWKFYYDLKIGEDVLSFDIDTRELVWKPIEAVYTYDIDTDIYSLQHRSMDILATAGHDMIVAKKEIGSITINGKRTRPIGDWKIYKEKMQDIEIGSYKKSIVVGAENGYRGAEYKTISDEWVELVGWFVTEGWYVGKNKTSNNGIYNKKQILHHQSFAITQSKPHDVEKIKDLIQRGGWPVTVGITKKEDFKEKYYKGHLVRCNYDIYRFSFKNNELHQLEEYVQDKQLNIVFLNKLTKPQLKLLFDTLIAADGHINKDGRISFAQNQNGTLNTMQVLCLMLGYSCSVIDKKNEKNKTLTINTTLYRQIKRNKPTKVHYKGIVWDPQIKDTHTWIARRNGRIDITGNSFSAGMTGKTLNSIFQNPQFFSKMDSALHEISGSQTPLEQEALKSKYYKWMSDAGMLKLPIFQKYPLYMNVNNFLPYYSLNILGDNSRNYSSQNLSNVMSVVDKLPILKDPIGSTIFDYFIQPMLLQHGEQPRGSFGSTLLPKDYTLKDQLLYGGRALAEIPTPTILGAPVGMAVGATGLGNKTINGVPISQYLPWYKGRTMAEATQGRNEKGIESKESAPSRVLRSIADYLGAKVYPLNTTYTEGQIKKEGLQSIDNQNNQ